MRLQEEIMRVKKEISKFVKYAGQPTLDPHALWAMLSGTTN